jgi:protoporphyrinogen oxidase
VRDLERIGFSPANAVKFAVTRTFRYAYVIYDLHHRRNTDKVLAWLSSIGITSVGRFSTFEYINSDQAIERARAAALAFASP